MCGINGFNFGDLATITAMNASIGHRGPDDRGTFVDSQVSLGHVRLSILDLSPRGHQPMVSPHERYWITYNGELYNFRSLRAELEDAGEAFTSDSDTEVILRAFALRGPVCLQEFNGIFAFAIYDSVVAKLYLVRDRLGVKPLYYTWDGDRLYFSSEIKTFERLQDLTLTLAETQVEEYLASHDIAGDSFYEEVVAVPAGAIVELDLATKRLQATRYVELTGAIAEDRFRRLRGTGRAALADELDGLLNTVVRDQLVSDAPIGTICSGGIDSSLITAIAARHKPDLQIYNVKVDDPQFDESVHAEAVASHLGLELKQVVLDAKAYRAWFRYCIASEDLPLVHPNSVGIFLLSRLARENGLSVLLSGEGADELFGGYHRYKAYRRRLLLEAIPFAARVIGPSHRLFTASDVHRADLSPDAGRKSGALWMDRRDESMRRFHAAYAFLGGSVEQEMKAFVAKDLEDYLPSILRRTDRMSMAVGLEMRVPYLDNRLVEFALNLPLPHQTSFTNVKLLLKQVARRYLPAAIVDRRKMGFPLPIEEWLGRQDVRQAFYDSWVAARRASA